LSKTVLAAMFSSSLGAIFEIIEFH
jgi:hypothetical protein